jgi:hypothetical protein
MNPIIIIKSLSSVIIDVMTVTNKRLLISESHDDSNRYTPCRGKPDQHETCFPRSVRVWFKTIRISRGPHIATLREAVNRVEQGHCSTEKKVSRHNPQHTCWSICGFIPIFSPKPTNEIVEAKSSICWRWLLGLPGSYHQHAIGTFNTCSRGPTHRSLTDTGGGYNLRGVGLPHTTRWPSQSAVSTFL